jgi:hypothetical protein
MPRYSLCTLLILLANGPPLVAVLYDSYRVSAQYSSPRLTPLDRDTEEVPIGPPR